MKTKITFLLSFLAVYYTNAQTLQWLYSFGDTGTEIGRSVTTDASGNVYTTGGFSGIVDFDPGPGTFTLNGTGSTFFISKMDAAGNFIWAKAIIGNTSVYAASIAVDVLGNVYSTGGLTGSADFDPGAATVLLTSAGNTDAFIFKLDPSGNYVWAKNFGNASAFEYGNSLTLDPSGDLYITGSYNGTNSDFDPSAASFTLSTNGSYDAFVAKYTSAGNFVWAKTLGGGIADYGQSIKVDASNNVYSTGYYQTTADFDPSTSTSYTLTATGMNDIYISKLDGAGNFIWAKSMGGTSNDWGYALDLDPSGNVLTTGGFQGTGDFDPGVGTFSLTFGGVFVSKLNNNGNFIWADKLAGSGSYGRAITTDAVGNVYITGGHNGGDFDPGTGVVTLNNMGFSDIFVSQLDASGNYLWAGTAGDFGTDNAYSISINNNAVYMTGSYNGAGPDFDPTSGTFSLTPVGGYDLFIMKLNIASTGLIELGNELKDISIYPNPSNGEFLINFTEEVKGDKQLTMFDINGKEILKQTIQAGVKQTELEIKSPGMYFINLEIEGKRLTKKVVVQ